jgi:alkylation response protein AidB-like acyl-CoA dehydrogenase
VDKFAGSLSKTMASDFGCSFLAAPSETVFSVEDFSADHNLMVETAEGFCRGEVLPRSEEIERQQEDLMPKLIAAAGALGLCGLDSPEQFGGLGQSKNLAARVLEFMSLDASFSVTFGITSGISQVGLTLFGNDAQRAQYLPKLTSGEWIGAYALSEPDSGSDALSASCRAERVPGGYALTGTKMWISNAKWADLFLVMAKIDGTAFSAFLVERGFLGVSIGREEHKMGLKGSSTARLVLENAFVPEANLLYEAGKGHHVAFNALNLGRFKLSSMSLGPARRAIEVASTYAQERKQFKRTISEFGLIQNKFAEMAARFYVAESMTYRTGALIDGAFAQGDGSWESNRVAAEEFSVECSCCKVFATEAESAIVDEALQVFGGYGFTEEFPIARIYRDARVSRIYEGTNEINRMFIADRLSKKIKEGKIEATVRQDSFIAELLLKALKHPPEGQVQAGALSDLIILHFADQSAKLRAKRQGDAATLLSRFAEPLLNLKAAEAYGKIGDEPICLPASTRTDPSEIADLVYANNSPLLAR